MEVAINFDDLAQVETLSTTASKVLVKLKHKQIYLFVKFCTIFHKVFWNKRKESSFQRSMEF